MVSKRKNKSKKKSRNHTYYDGTHMPQATPVSSSRNSQCKGSCTLGRAPGREPWFCGAPLDFLRLSLWDKHGQHPTLNVTASHYHRANKVKHKSCKARAQRTCRHSKAKEGAATALGAGCTWRQGACAAHTGARLFSDCRNRF